jgi:hypothetical protein
VVAAVGHPVLQAAGAPHQVGVGSSALLHQVLLLLLPLVVAAGGQQQEEQQAARAWLRRKQRGRH